MNYDHPTIDVTTVSVLATYRCTAACDNCCFDCHPKVEGRLSLEEIIDFIDGICQLGTVKVVVFSGGECFLLGDDLALAVQYASERGLATRCVTNGYWARNRDVGRRRLAPHVDTGLNELNISTGDYHQEFVPQSAVINAAILGVEAGLENTLIIVEASKIAQVTRDAILGDLDLRALWDRSTRSEFDILTSAWMPMSSEETINQSSNAMLNQSNVHKRKGCTDVLTTLTLAPSGKLGVCCGLSREKIPRLNFEWKKESLLQDIARQNLDFLKIWIHIDGPEKILAWAASKNPAIQWEDRYSHHCHACLALFDSPLVREVIEEHYRERVDDVLLRFAVKSRTQKLQSINKQLADDFDGI